MRSKKDKSAKPIKFKYSVFEYFEFHLGQKLPKIKNGKKGQK